ncbi:hypothetical protein [Streptomyces kronopolitis]|uniref:hypothetical protein n=1 Tax=Streptomyces kronopolitis TaxID=1612435 RepID=UPI00343804E8
MKYRTILPVTALVAASAVLAPQASAASNAGISAKAMAVAAGGAHCTATPQNPHRSSGAGDGRILFKTRVTCKGSYPSVTVHINGVLEEGPDVGPKRIAAKSSETQVIKNGKTATFYTPGASGKQEKSPGRYRGRISGQITSPVPGNFDDGFTQWVLLK